MALRTAGRGLGAEEAKGKFITVDGDVREDAGDADPMPTVLGGTDSRCETLDLRTLFVRRRCESPRCRTGQAIDMAGDAWRKGVLSDFSTTICVMETVSWGFTDLDQLTKFRMDPDDGRYRQMVFFQGRIEKAVAEAVEIRKRLRAIPIRDIRDVGDHGPVGRRSEEKSRSHRLVADAMIGAVLRGNRNIRTIDLALESLAMQAGVFLNGDKRMGAAIAMKALEALSVDLPEDKPPRKPFHWPLEFPEVFARTNGGFDSMLGNPPFMFGKTSRTTWERHTMPI
jgi:hypothetical protein